MPHPVRLDDIAWHGVRDALWERGHATVPGVLSADTCESLAGLFDDAARFRSRIDMARHRFGVGTYQYFAAPLPDTVSTLRRELYPPLARVANEWSAALGLGLSYPPSLDGFLVRCAEAGQTRPTPLLLRYDAGGYNCLHQDLYGPVAFPLQVVALLSRPGVDYEGGEFLLVEQRPRAQSIGHVVAVEQGDLIVFTTAIRPARGARGVHRVAMRHGVSRVRAGRRHALGIIFHDAR